MCLDLEKYGIIENKTWNMLIKNIPKEYYYSFLLGYFDGDGSIYSYYINYLLLYSPFPHLFFLRPFHFLVEDLE